MLRRNSIDIKRELYKIRCFNRQTTQFINKCSVEQLVDGEVPIVPYRAKARLVVRGVGIGSNTGYGFNSVGSDMDG